MPICRQFIDTLYRGKSFTTKIMRSHLWLSATSNSHTNQMITVFILTIARAACLDGQGRTSSLEGVDGAHPTIQSDSLSRSSSDHASLLEDKVQYQSGNRYFHSDPRCIEDLLYLGLEEIASVNTKYGKLTGRISYLCDFPGSIEAPLGRRPRVMANVTLFLGVPYAKAPTKENNLRFKSPRPPDFWGSIDAAQYKASCPQPIEFTGPHRMIDRVSEDCLYINIFSPTVSATSSLFPVMVYIHDGDFEHGSGNSFPGHMLSASQQVVVVTFNYRLGLLGYFSTGDNCSAGNFGLLDQMQALHFIRENIKHFRGDASEITVFGSGSGAVSASLLALSPLSSNLVKRVIASSGSPLADWALVKNSQASVNLSNTAALAYGCSSWNSINGSCHLVNCLSSRSSNDILSSKKSINYNRWLSWAPVIDSASRDVSLQTVPHPPEILVRLQSQSSWKRNNFAYMTGVNRDDGAHRLAEDGVFARRNNFADSEYLARVIKSFVSLYTGTVDGESKPLEEAIKFFYAPCCGEEADDSHRIISSIVNMFTDSFYLAPAYSMVQQLLQQDVPTYLYLLNYSIACLQLPPWQSVPHQAEYLLLSGGPFLHSSFYPSALNLHRCKWTQSDRNISQFIMQAWSNFAKFGNPTPVPAFGSIVWKAARKLDSLWHLLINDISSHQSTRMDSNYRSKYAQFWSHYVQVVLKQQPSVTSVPYESTQMQIRFYCTIFWTLVVLSLLFLFITLLCSCLLCSHSRNLKKNKQKYLEELTQVEHSMTVPTKGVSKKNNSPKKTHSKSSVREPKGGKITFRREQHRDTSCSPNRWKPFVVDPQRTAFSLSEPNPLQLQRQIANDQISSLDADSLSQVCKSNEPNNLYAEAKPSRNITWARKSVCHPVTSSQSSHVQVEEDFTSKNAPLQKEKEPSNQMSGRKKKYPSSPRPERRRSSCQSHDAGGKEDQIFLGKRSQV